MPSSSQNTVTQLLTIEKLRNDKEASGDESADDNDDDDSLTNEIIDISSLFSVVNKRIGKLEKKVMARLDVIDTKIEKAIENSVKKHMAVLSSIKPPTSSSAMLIKASAATQPPSVENNEELNVARPVTLNLDVVGKTISTVEEFIALEKSLEDPDIVREYVSVQY